ncbi:carbohydrate ABC transporter permease [Nocardia sp. NPDC004711]
MTRKTLGQLTLQLALACGGIVVLLPFAWMVLASFKTPDEVLSTSLLPTHWTIANYRVAFGQVPWARYYINTFTVTAAIVIGQVLVAVPAGYALARLRFRGAHLGLWTIVAAISVPPQAIAIPVYLGLSRAGLIDTRWALVLPFVGSALGIFLFRQFLLSVPQSLFDAARIDGVGEIAMAFRLALPLLRPAIGAFAALATISHWNEFFWPTLVLNSDRAAPVSYGVARFADQQFGNNYGVEMASGVVAVVPLIVLFLLVQRPFARGMALHASYQ